ncbi:MAG: hypothetical protein N3H84_00345 [Candidatus Caldarchaeum sp.]|nr:hypothetical protein [Candidatus Caldarchaeum sp.]MCX8200543.1 hypothetical protein [Candidatus Caldarchaeum sp.]MDW8434608.1 hypothetical protein [Candidatus Caldarchaeum sp.]
MATSFAVSFENRIRRDRTIFILKLEFLIIFTSAFVVLSITNQHILLKTVFAGLASATFFILLKDRLQRAGRRLRRAVVRSVRYAGPDWFFFLPVNQPFSLNPAGYEIEAVSEDFRLIRFLDWKPWKIGQQLLVLSDVSGKVLAVRDIRQPLKLELLKNLA